MDPIAGVARRQMRMIFMVDASGSMSVDRKMDTLNLAMQQGLKPQQGHWVKGSLLPLGWHWLKGDSRRNSGARWWIITPM